MAKYSRAIVERICKLISMDSYTIAEICEIVGIADRTYYDWQSKNAEFAASIEKAQDKFNEKLIAEAKKSLIRMVQGYTVQEKKTVTVDTGKKDENQKPIVRVKEHTVTDKHYQPNSTLIIFTLTNRDPKKWPNNRNFNDQFAAAHNGPEEDKPATMKLPDGTEIEV